MTIKVFIAPQYPMADRGEGGIRRVVEAQNRYLPDYGIEVSDSIADCDLTIGHGILKPRRKDVPFVTNCHGMHWADYRWGEWAHNINAMVRDALIEADSITVTSHWVKNAITRGLLRSPTVIYHGVDSNDWKHRKKTQNYILWNKGRYDPVSDSGDMNKIAMLMPDLRFVSTFGLDAPNVEIIGHKDLSQMKPIVQKAMLLLATSRETFGIGTLEALASGVPVVGWDYGGQREIIKQGETGYLAPFGDYQALSDCIRLALQHRDRLSANCVSDVEARWQWPDKIAQYAELFKRVVEDYRRPRPIVSVIVTCHNLGRYLPDALSSVLSQTLESWECLIIDDQSTDNTQQVALEFCKRDKRFHYYKTDRNLKLSAALNYGFERSKGRYILNLDADNMLPQIALQALSEALDADQSIHIASGDLDIVDKSGNNRRDRIWHNKSDFDWRAQIAHINQIHSSSMMRRVVMEEIGGYRTRYWRAEDAHFWTLATSFGFRAKIVTGQSTLIYRMRDDSKSADESRAYPDRDGDWTIDFPYRIAGTSQDGFRLLKETTGVPNAQAVPFSAQGRPTINSSLCWNVYHHEDPLVSVVIPVGPGHADRVIDACDSLQAQDFIDWEAIIVNDTGKELAEIRGAPYARVITTGGQLGTAAARNKGLDAARGKLVIFLDADDMLASKALRKMIAGYVESEASFIFTDQIQIDNSNRSVIYSPPEYDQKDWKVYNGVTILIAKQDALKVGGFDETLEGWEDWDFFSKLKIHGLCGRRLPIPGFIYRPDLGTRSVKSFDNRDRLLAVFRERYSRYFDGVEKMSNCCGGNADVVLAAKHALNEADKAAGGAGLYKTLPEEKAEQRSGLGEFVRMEFIGERKGGVTYFGSEGRQYVGGNNPYDRFVNVHPADVHKLEQTLVWRVVPKPAEVIPEPPKLESVEVSDAMLSLETMTQASAIAPEIDLGTKNKNQSKRKNKKAQ